MLPTSSLANHTSSQMGSYSAMAAGDIRVIDVLACDLTHTQHSPLGLVLCMHRIKHQEAYNYYIFQP